MDAQLLPSLIVIWLTFAQSIRSACINESVVALPVTEVVLSNEHTVRGVPISVGTPPTNISFLPEAVYNDTCERSMLFSLITDICSQAIRDIQ